MNRKEVDRKEKECEEVRTKLPEFRQGGLSDSERRVVSDHLDGCHRCNLEVVRIHSLENGYALPSAATTLAA